ncbi:MAG: YdeI/OmpD-associated family protein [Jejuia sp.]
MKYSVQDYLEKHVNYKDALELLRATLLSTELEETIKWNFPVYTLNNKNVIGLGAFKNHFGIWFFNGVFLKDEQNLLVNAQDGKTKAMRQMRFKSIDDINEEVVIAYVNEAIENQKLGKEVKPERHKKEVNLPPELVTAFDRNVNLKKAFEKLSNYKQREYCEYITVAKRIATKETRLEKIIPMILEGIGLNDKYKNC